MPVISGEIYYLDAATARLRDSESARFVLVLRVENDHAHIAYFSSRFEIFNPAKHISIYKEWDEFPATGLKLDCYLVTEPLGYTKLSNLMDRRGENCRSVQTGRGRLVGRSALTLSRGDTTRGQRG